MDDVRQRILQLIAEGPVPARPDTDEDRAFFGLEPGEPLPEPECLLAPPLVMHCEWCGAKWDPLFGGIEHHAGCPLE